MSHISDHQFLVVPAYIHTCLYRGFCVSSRGFLSGGFVWGFFVWKVCPGWFLSVPLLSEYIRYNRKLNITINFRFHMYAFFLKCDVTDVTCSWTPSPVTNCHTFSDPRPLERDVLYGRPLTSQSSPITD